MTVIHWMPDALLGGCEMALLTFVKGAGRHRHVVLTDREGPACALWRDAGAEVVAIGDWHRSPFVWARGLRRKLESLGATSLLAWSPSRLPWLHRAASLAGVRRIVVHIGTNIPLPRRTAMLYDALQALWRPKSDLRLVCCSEAVATRVAAGPYFQKFPSTVIYNGVRAEFFVPADPGSDSVDIIIGSVARLDALKGQAMLIAALPEILRVAPQARLRLIGEGPDRDSLGQQAESLGVADRVEFAGRRTDIPAQLAAMSVFVFASSPQEGMGIALAEAMARGVPCVVSDTPTMREVGADGAVYATPTAAGFAEKIRELLADAPARRALAAIARRRAQELFSPESFAAGYLRLLEAGA